MTTEYIKKIYKNGDVQQAVDLLRTEHTNVEVIEILQEWGTAPKSTLDNTLRAR